MQNTEFYIKYQTNNPWPIDIEFDKRHNGGSIKTVDHLISACLVDPIKSQIGLPKEIVPLRLYIVKEGESLSIDLLLTDVKSIDASIGTFDNPLVIKQSNQLD